MQSNIKRLIQFLSIAIIAGFITGFLISAIDIASHRYIEYGTINLALSSLGEHLTKYTLEIVLASIVLIAFIALGRKINEYVVSKSPILSTILNNRLIGSVLISLVLLYIFKEVSFYYYKEIIMYLKDSPLNELLGQVTDSKRDTRKIYGTVINVSGIAAFIIITFTLYITRFSERLSNAINKASLSGFVQYSAIFLVVVIVILNIYLSANSRLSTPQGPNIVLISIDTLRADRLGSYGNPRNASPNIDSVASKGVLFENAYSQAPWTLPAMATVHTSLYPTEHGVIVGNLAIKKNLNTLAEHLKNNNYKTLAITTHPYVDIKHGFGQGFDVFDERNHKGANDSSAQRITQKAKNLLRENKDDKFFLWLHYFDPHSSYLNHEEYSYGTKPREEFPDAINAGQMNGMIDELSEEDVRYIVDIYDEEVSYTDSSVGEIVDTISELGLEKDTVIIITSDHGEEFLDRTRFGHGRTTYDELVRVPLIVYHPERESELAGLRVEHSVETRVIPKTVAVITGMDNGNFGGNDLFAVAKDSGDSEEYFAYSEGSSAGSNGILNHAIIGNDWKLIKNIREDSFELYNLREDPGEKINLIDSDEQETDVMRGILSSELSEFKKERLVELERVEFSKEDIEELKALGYMQ